MYMVPAVCQFITLFAALYYWMGPDTPGVLGQKSLPTVIDSLYFSIATFATVGYGDLQPATQLGRGVTMIQIGVGLSLVTVVLALLICGIGWLVGALARKPHADWPQDF